MAKISKPKPLKFHNDKRKVDVSSQHIVRCLFGHHFLLSDITYTWDELFVCPTCDKDDVCNDHSSKCFNELYYKCDRCNRFDPLTFSNLNDWKCKKCHLVRRTN